MAAEGDFHDLAGTGGNDTFLGGHSEAAAERGVGEGQAEGGIDKPNIGKLQLCKKAESHDTITLVFRSHLERICERVQEGLWDEGMIDRVQRHQVSLFPKRTLFVCPED